jgi:katanin p60 ATPase-containing subunit A1
VSPDGRKGGAAAGSPDDAAAERPKFRDGEPELIEQLERDVMDVKQSVSWEAIAGLHEVKLRLKEAVLMPFLFPQFFIGIRRPWKGILLYGPPGTGKTLLAKAVATLSSTTFFSCSVAALGSKWRGESEKLVRLLFRMARFYAPATIFFDEVDSIGTSRSSDGENEASRRVKSELLTQMDGMDSSAPSPAAEGGEPPENKTVIVIGATNFPWDLDEALRRRFEKRIYIPLPDLEARRELLGINLSTVEWDESLDVDALAERMEGYSGADITSVCRDASMMGMRKVMQGLEGKDLKSVNPSEFAAPITQSDFEAALIKVHPSVGKADIAKFEKWRADYGAE